ncbi:MAG: C40 family peptidase [Chloroflexia bacterium]|nr:C40 family peptidase [Chloroflexia bacterium]
MIQRGRGLATPGLKRPRRLAPDAGGRRLGRRGALAILAGAAVAGVAGLDHEAAAAAKAKRIVREAKKHKGARYVAGGTGPRAFDCSGFTCYVVKKATGKDITPSLQLQVDQAGKRIKKKRRKKGDLIFFNLEGGRRVTHVAIVLGRHKVIHAMNPELDVRTSDISDGSYWKVHSVRRM